MTNNDDPSALRNAASNRYKPKKVATLFIEEAPPCDEDRYFYFANIYDKDSLWIELTRTLYGGEFGAASDERKRKNFGCGGFVMMVVILLTRSKPRSCRSRRKSD